jgi:hypothetical protein
LLSPPERLVANLDVRAIIGEVAARHGVRMDSDDPLVLALVANGVVLEFLAEELMSGVRQVTARLPGETEAALTAAATRTAESLRQAVQADIESASLKARAIVDAVHRAHSRPAKYRWVVIGLAAGLAQFLLGIWVGCNWP